MDARPRDIEILPDKWRSRRNLVSDFLFVILGKLRDYRRVHSVKRSLKLRVLKYHSFKRRVARALPYSKERSVYARAAVEPRRSRVDHRLVKIIVPVPLNPFVRHSRMRMYRVYDALNASRNNRARKVYAIAHCITRTDYYRYVIVLLRKLHKLLAEWHYVPINISPRYIL